MSNNTLTVWVTAMESGNYVKARSRFERHNGSTVSYCALGLLKAISPNDFRKLSDGRRTIISQINDSTAGFSSVVTWVKSNLM
jgi:hypothetical protein